MRHQVVVGSGAAEKNDLLASEKWLDSNNERLVREAIERGELPPQKILLEPEPSLRRFDKNDRDEVAESMAVRLARQHGFGGPSSAQRHHQDASARARSSSAKRRKKPKKWHQKALGDMVIVAGDDYDGLTAAPCDFALHPAYSEFCKRSGLQARHLLLFLRCVPQYVGELDEWRAAFAEAQRGIGRTGRPLKFGNIAPDWWRERVPKRSGEHFGIELSRSAELSVVVNFACATFIWYVSRLFHDASETSSSIERAETLTSSVAECTRLTVMIRDEHPSASLLSMIGAQTYKLNSDSDANSTRSALRPFFAEKVDELTDDDVNRSGAAQLGRLIKTAREASDRAISEAQIKASVSTARNNR